SGGPPRARGRVSGAGSARLAEVDVAAHDGVELAQDDPVGVVAAVLAGRVREPGPGGGPERGHGMEFGAGGHRCFSPRTRTCAADGGGPLVVVRCPGWGGRRERHRSVPSFPSGRSSRPTVENSSQVPVVPAAPDGRGTPSKDGVSSDESPSPAGTGAPRSRRGESDAPVHVPGGRPRARRGLRPARVPA